MHVYPEVVLWDHIAIARGTPGAFAPLRLILLDSLQQKRALTAALLQPCCNLPDVPIAHSKRLCAGRHHHQATRSVAVAGMRGPSPKVDIHLVVNVGDDLPASERDACSSPAVASLLRSNAAAASEGATPPAAVAAASPGHAVRTPARQLGGISGGAGTGAADTAEPKRGWSAALGEAATAAAASPGDAQVVACTVPEMRAEMAHHLALEYAAQYRCGCAANVPSWAAARLLRSALCGLGTLTCQQNSP